MKKAQFPPLSFAREISSFAGFVLVDSCEPWVKWFLGVNEYTEYGYSRVFVTRGPDWLVRVYCDHMAEGWPCVVDDRDGQRLIIRSDRGDVGKISVV